MVAGGSQVGSAPVTHRQPLQVPLLNIFNTLIPGSYEITEKTISLIILFLSDAQLLCSIIQWIY